MELNLHDRRVVDANELTPPLSHRGQHFLQGFLELWVVSKLASAAIPNQHECRPIEFLEGF